MPTKRNKLKKAILPRPSSVQSADNDDLMDDLLAQLDSRDNEQSNELQAESDIGPVNTSPRVKNVLKKDSRSRHEARQVRECDRTESLHLD